MNLFEGVCRELSKSTGTITFDGIGRAIGKSSMSVKGEIGRLKKTTWIKKWIHVKWETDEVTLAQDLRGCRPETLVFLIKQFYNFDKLTKKGLHAPGKGLDLNMEPDTDIIEDLDKQLNTIVDFQKDVKEPMSPIKFDDIDFDKLMTVNK